MGKKSVGQYMLRLVRTMVTQSHKSLKRARKNAVLDIVDTLRDPMASDSVLLNDIKRVLGAANPPTTLDQVQNKLISPAMMKKIRREERSDEGATERPEKELIHQKYEVEVSISGLGADGDGIAIEEREDGEKRVLVVPFALPGDKVKVRVYKKNLYFFQSEIVEVISKGDLRDDALTSCKYFGECSGCQYQFMDYEKQLNQKRNVVVNAFRYYCHTEDAVLPEVGPTFPSPETMGYRTKLTPHYDVPKTKSPEWLASPPPYGFNMKTVNRVLDIEDCPIGTPVVREGLKESREDVKLHYKTAKRGKTYLLRENTIKKEEGTFDKRCVTDNKAIVSEYIDNYRFDFTAGEFFQNNNSILPAVTAYVRENILLDGGKPPRFLVDAYCGSGLFSITCSQAVEKVYGVEISDESVKFARKNAELNKINNAVFLTGKAENIFKDLDCDPAQTCMIIDPPRKGTDEAFINQLVTFQPQRLVYVSCNVHTQARDVAYLLKQCPEYKVESIRGFDFFPQTKHVEGVAVLSYNGERTKREINGEVNSKTNCGVTNGETNGEINGTKIEETNETKG
ncbi:S-adenosyl-L-methionine-dependent methyltransferase [Yarrowia lipolytica]|uniref:tRNA (uracil(54)-C(5))-methyltransferase n=1 Tax=Yarrowia lipolytica (strain CLIB 122 / E 150) TaxID=284591 RepID=Q6C110_YARLI|nr:YALI0F20196p [Yarrowia lipolytica CLIB122]RDW35975.1 S-adenosyl-L-methionine-dependent methyltransferase [Yarrowia lipolytica]RDW42240.1 S-adenosyl-L-methionine-dependent methyltransferase [Yarrowia lipolytica]RDW49511.1 S-adenosyl-L-methionine-dependent methyltransferase [Yarrowia lipolytica]RDW55487.1 S-adenosyl-L-methionine-dependent methyltransferase [Yarrowia lipolytica]CAG78461.1 YALI0F20196p [Yarrowia lipolytica CLIB122]|eukprot:XP_505652.1 YALI0F20196p [Yarrowia lipolytica CLIB122]